MSEEYKKILYDKALDIECSYFYNMKQSFISQDCDCYVIGFIEQGDRDFFYNKRIYHIEKNDLIIINPNTKRYCNSVAPENGLTYRSINIKKESIERLLSIRILGNDLIFTSIVINDDYIKSSFLELHRKIIDVDKDEDLKKKLLINLLKYLVIHYAKYSYNLTSINKYVLKFIKLLEDNFYANISIENLCKNTGISRGHLFRIFFKEMGTTPHQYILKKRLEKSMDLIAEGKDSCNIAVELGFTDQTHFIKCFKSTLGITPFQYMRSIKMR